MLPDGRILVVGNGGQLVRLAVNGSLDPSFGSGGVVTSPGAARSDPTGATRCY
jgi:hypothetical protein